MDTTSALVLTIVGFGALAWVIIEVNKRLPSPPPEPEADRQDPRRGSGCGAHVVALSISFLAVVILGIAAFYFLVWEQPAARCSRGDIGACMVVTQR